MAWFWARDILVFDSDVTCDCCINSAETVPDADVQVPVQVAANRNHQQQASQQPSREENPMVSLPVNAREPNGRGQSGEDLAGVKRGPGVLNSNTPLSIRNVSPAVLETPLHSRRNRKPNQFHSVHKPHSRKKGETEQQFDCRFCETETAMTLPPKLLLFH